MPDSRMILEWWHLGYGTNSKLSVSEPEDPTKIKQDSRHYLNYINIYT